jgi:carbonic anhydrase/acetyltransferase-like protein (isoleucine patch superfamily)
MSASPPVPASAWVARNATLVGRVVLGEHVSVFYGAVLRADINTIAVGDRSNLQDNVVVHVDSDAPTAIGSDVSIGHGAVVHGCTVEDGCLIGINSTLLSHSVIGAGSLVAAGAVVLEGTVVPPGSLVAGVPAKIRRQLTEEERAQIRHNADHYLQISAAHRELAVSRSIDVEVAQ